MTGAYVRGVVRQRKGTGSDAAASTAGPSRGRFLRELRQPRPRPMPARHAPAQGSRRSKAGIVRIRQLRDADADVAGAVLARAFLDSPTFVAAVPDPARRERLCAPLFIFNLRHACRFGEAWALQDPEGAVVAAAYTVDRPEPPLTPELAVDLGFTALGREWAPELDRLGALEAAAARHLETLPEPWRYLGAIGVEPRLQRQGLGGILLAHLLARAGALAVGLVTDHAEAVPFYERAGFAVAWSGTPTPGGPTFWTMRTGRERPGAAGSESRKL